MTKFIFVTGGVVSGLGKGIVAASLGRLLKSAGYTVAVEKFDPYMNIDPGTLNPVQHGEVFVTADGAETDLDLGHYERFIGVNLTKDSSLTRGGIRRKNGADRAARHQRNQKSHQARGEKIGRGRSDHGNRRHNGRHRIATLSGSPSSVPYRRGRRKLRVYPRVPASVTRLFGRIQIEARATFRTRIARVRNPPRRNRVAFG